MRMNTVIQNSKGKFLVRTVPASDNIEFGNGFETQVHPYVDGEPNMYKSVDYKHSENRSQAAGVHQQVVDKHRKF